jgi:hypothetical protein
MNYISKSGADFLEMSNAKRLEENKTKLESLLNTMSGMTSFQKTFNNEVKNLKHLIARAEDWIAKNGEPPVRTFDIYKVIRYNGGERPDETRHFLDEAKAREWGLGAEHYDIFRNKELLPN